MAPASFAETIAGSAGVGRDRPVDAEVRVERSDRDAGHARHPLRVEAVQVLAAALGDRLEAVAHPGRHEHLDADGQRHA